MAYNFGRVCLSVCQTITFESLDVESSYLHIRYISREWPTVSSCMKVKITWAKKFEDPCFRKLESETRQKEIEALAKQKEKKVQMKKRLSEKLQLEKKRLICN